MRIFICLKKVRYILLSIFIISIIIYNIFVQKNIIDYEKTIYNIVYMFIFIFINWVIIELMIFKRNYSNTFEIKKNKESIRQENKNYSSFKSVDRNYKTSFGDDTITKIADGFNNNKKKTTRYCINCHREIYSSNYTGTNLCTECKKHYYKKGEI